MLCVDKPDFPECSMYDKGEIPGRENEEEIPLEARLAPPQPIVVENSDEVYQGEDEVKVIQGENEVFQGENELYSNDAPAAANYRELSFAEKNLQQEREAVHGNAVEVKTERRESKPRPRHLRRQQNPDGAVFEPEK